MKRYISVLLTVAAASLMFTGCYNPQLNEFPFVCGGKPGAGECPDGYSCYGGHCLEQPPECWQDNYFAIGVGGKSDVNLEPNNLPTQAVLLPCGDIDYSQTCPHRYVDENNADEVKQYSQNLTGLAICPAGDYDFYGFWMGPCDIIVIDMLYNTNNQMGRDLDMEILMPITQPDGSIKYDNPQGDVISSTTTDNEDLRFQAQAPGWYYLWVHGRDKDPETGDMNAYALQYYFIQGSMDNNGSCIDPAQVAQ